MIGNRHGVTAVGNQSSLLASITADGGSDYKLEIDDASKLRVGMAVDIVNKTTGSVLATNRTIQDILDDVSAEVATTVAGVAAVAEIQTITVDATAGTFTITYAGQTTAALAFDVAAADMQTALVALSNIAPGDVVVTGGPGAAGGGTPYTLTWDDSLGNVAQVTCTNVDLTGGGDSVIPETSQAGVAAVNEQETITIVADGGYFTITYDGDTTDPLDWNASADEVENALMALDSIGDGNVSVTLANQVYTVTFIGDLGGQNITPMTTDETHLEMGTITVTYSGADVDPTTAYGLYPVGGYEASVDVNINGGSTPGAGFSLDALNDIDSMKNYLSRYNDDTYTEEVLATMTFNDLAYAVRVIEASDSI